MHTIIDSTSRIVKIVPVWSRCRRRCGWWEPK